MSNPVSALKSLIAKVPRNVTHFVVVFLGAVVPTLAFSSLSALRASLFAAIPAAALVLFRTYVSPSNAAKVVTVARQVEAAPVPAEVKTIAGDIATAASPPATPPAK